jgi:hypothetical protein
VKRALIELAEYEQVRPEGRCTAQELLEMNNWVNNAPHLQVQLLEKSPTKLCMWLNSEHDQVEGWQESCWRYEIDVYFLPIGTNIWFSWVME